MRTADERFWAKVSRTSTCWNWTGAKIAAGYGNFYVGNKVWALAHRWSYQEANGDLQPDMQVDHLCRNVSCVRPSHLEQVTQQENIRRAGLTGAASVNASRIACSLCGGPFSVKNGRRVCAPCRRNYQQQWHSTKMATDSAYAERYRKTKRESARRAYLRKKVAA